MLMVGITGGIGSGKSVVCQVFNTLGIPVFNADLAARFLMENDQPLVQSIKSLLGSEVYNNGILDRPKVASIIFGKPELLAKLNALVHPVTIKYANDWLIKQTAPYAIKEAAIFFESGSYSEMDVMIGVYAPQELRISRAMSRGKQTRDEVLNIIARQMNEEEKMNRCDYVITNDDVAAVLPQVLKLHEELMQRSITQPGP